MDSVTLEDWYEEIFADGVGVKLRKWARGGGGGEGKIPIFYFPLPQPLPRLCTNRLPVKHPVTIQDGAVLKYVLL